MKQSLDHYQQVAARRRAARWGDRTPMERFADKISPEPNTGCWLWCAAASRQGYGSFTLDGKTSILAHRAAWLLFRGAIGEWQVLHRCDTPSCVNPDHLFLGTNADNVRDCTRKGRWVLKTRPGTKNGRAILTEDNVRDIRTRALTMAAYAKKYGVSNATVGMIWINKNWRWLP